eukprot:jgi/Mesvir1/6443/Mv19525-RA.3
MASTLCHRCHLAQACGPDEQVTRKALGACPLPTRLNVAASHSLGTTRANSRVGCTARAKFASGFLSGGHGLENGLWLLGATPCRECGVGGLAGPGVGVQPGPTKPAFASRRQRGAGEIRRPPPASAVASSSLHLNGEKDDDGSSLIEEAPPSNASKSNANIASSTEFTWKGCSVDLEGYMSVYNSLLQSNRLEECVQLLECIYAGSGIQHLRKLVHRDFLRACQRSKDVRSAFRFVTVVESSAHIGAFTMLVAVCAEARDVNGALSVLEWVQRRGLTPDCKLYTAVISACAKAGSPNRAFRVYQEMLARNVEPTLVTYSALIDAFSRAHKVDRAFKLYNEAIIKGIKPDTVLYNILITAAVREGLVARALKIMELMQADGIAPNAVTYGALVHGCSQPGPEQDVNQALALYERMRRDGIQPTVAVYTAAVDACAVTGDLDAAMRIYGHLKQARARPDETFFSALIKVAGSAHQLDAAASLLATLESEHRIRATAVSYGALIGVCEKMGETERALEAFEAMRKADVLPSASIYNILIHMLGKAKQLGKAVAILDDMVAINVAPTDVTYGTLLGACARAGNVSMAFQLYSRMRAEGIAINLVICNTLIGICLAAIRSGTPPPMMAGEAYYSADASSFGSGGGATFGGASFKQRPTASTQEQWVNRAIGIYSDALVAGLELPMATVSALLACLAVRPGSSAGAMASMPFGAGPLNGAGAPGGRFGVGAPYGSGGAGAPGGFGAFQVGGDADVSRVVDVTVDGCNIYRPRALDIYEESMARGALPSFTLDRNSVVDLTNVPPPAAEVMPRTAQALGLNQAPPPPPLLGPERAWECARECGGCRFCTCAQVLARKCVGRTGTKGGIAMSACS